MKKGFTLIELLVVIVIIGVLSLIIVPSLIRINENVNERLLSQKIENIESAAQLYARNNEEIFNGATKVRIYVYQLVDANYLTIDLKDNTTNCTSDGEKGIDSENKTEKGCVQNPVTKDSMNSDFVELTRNGTGFIAEYFSQKDPGDNVVPITLVDAVCLGFANGDFIGQAYLGDTIVSCRCDAPSDPTKLITDSGVEVNACLIAGDSPQNYLRYGSATDPNWRVLGVYKLDEGLSAKMITIGPIKE